MCDGIGIGHIEGSIKKLRLILGERRKSFPHREILSVARYKRNLVTWAQSTLGRTTDTGNSEQQHSLESCWNLLFF